jgi:hypothetical protein
MERSCRDCAGCTCVEPWLTWLYCESAPRLGGRCGPAIMPGCPVGPAVFGSRDILLTADTKDSALLASFGGTVGARVDGCGGGKFDEGGAFGELLPTMPLIAAASLGFEAGFSGDGAPG